MKPKTSKTVFNSLVSGGVSAPAAAQIANAIDNKNAAQVAHSASYSDATNKAALRMVSADTRKYELTNLDFRHEKQYQQAATKTERVFSPPPVDHPYKDSQPQLINSPLSSSPILAGPYIKTVDTVTSGAVQSTVALNIGLATGVNLRINKGSQTLEAVPMTVRNTTNFPLTYSFDSTEQGIELVLTGANLVEFEFPINAVSIAGVPNPAPIKALMFMK